MYSYKYDKILSILASIGIAALVLVLAVTGAHAAFTGGQLSFGQYVKAALIPLILSVVSVIVGFVYKKFRKPEEEEEPVGAATIRVDEYLNSTDTSSFNKTKTAQAMSAIKRRNVIDIVASMVCTASLVFVIDYILFIAEYSTKSVGGNIFGAWFVSLIFAVIAIGAMTLRAKLSDQYSEYAYDLLQSAAVSSDDESIVTMKQRDMGQVTAKHKAVKVISLAVTYLFLLVIAVIVLFPFYWMIISSLKTIDEYRLAVPTLFPKEVVWYNYPNAFNTANLGTLFMNTMYVGIVSTILSLVITVISAFAFARLEFKGRDALFAFLLATMMIPGELFTITNYVTVTKLGWINSYTVLIVPFLVSVFYMYLLKQNFLQIPNELYLAAKVDGTTDLKYLWKVMIPLSFPTLVSITILKMMGAWNSYVWPRLVANDKAYQLITNCLRNSFTNSEGFVDYPLQMAAVAIVSAPLFLVFIFLRKYIMKGVSRSGIKG